MKAAFSKLVNSIIKHCGLHIFKQEKVLSTITKSLALNIQDFSI